MPRGVKTSRSVNKAGSRELKMRDDDQRYGIVTKLLGNNRVMVNIIEDNKVSRECRCTIRGSMRRREWIRVDNVVLVALRDFADDVHDIIGKYNDDEVKTLTRMGELVIPEEDDDDTVDIVFEDVDTI